MESSCAKIEKLELFIPLWYNSARVHIGIVPRLGVAGSFCSGGIAKSSGSKTAQVEAGRPTTVYRETTHIGRGSIVRPNARAWRAREEQSSVGSNPTLSATL